MTDNLAVGAVTVEELVAKCLTIGLTMRQRPHYDITHPPLALQPTRVSRNSFQFITELQPEWNRLVDAVARDFDFLQSSLAVCGASDTGFTGRLLSILSDVYMKPAARFQDAMLGIYRSDYMRSAASRQSGEQEWKHVEINTISCSFAGLAPRVATFHKYLGAALKGESVAAWDPADIVRTPSDEAVPSALFAAHSHALTTGFVDLQSATLTPVVVFVIQDNERNTGDQFLLSIRLLEAHGVRSIRRTMSQLHQTMRLIDGDGSHNGLPTAVIDETYAATVFYFRCAYVPQDFIDETCWAARHAIELSSAIKCPSVPVQLAGYKKIQQLLSSDAVLARFCPDAGIRERLQSTFMLQLSLDPDEVGSAASEAAIADAVAHPRKYVLKPQLEGGGNLYSGDGLVRVLQLDDPSDRLYRAVRKEFVLMERIVYPKTSGAILKNGEVHQFDNNLCCEVGVYGVVLSTSSSSSPLLNATAGVNVRTKPADIDDGGVMAGVAALDSIALTA